ncbi:hypothetical protein L1887_40694 [Cichorium endivia]|nr:hypothetical protein L1887_40694 [Cichorium endivia]
MLTASIITVHSYSSFQMAYSLNLSLKWKKATRLGREENQNTSLSSSFDKEKWAFDSKGKITTYFLIVEDNCSKANGWAQLNLNILLAEQSLETSDLESKAKLERIPVY